MLTGEQRPGDESQHVAGLAGEIDNKQFLALTSALTRMEILECTLTAQQREVMERLIRPPKVQVKDVAQAVLDLGHEIRNFYQELKASGQSNLPTVETPDAIHLATAIYYGCDTFFTFDANDHPGGSKPRRALIPLTGTIAEKYPLTICKPYSASLGLPL